jgi:SAM-dependent methyltransferase
MLTPACGVGEIIHGDLAPARMNRRRPALVCDEEQLAIAPESLDLIVSLLTLHDVNDLVGALGQWRRALKPDGLFLGALFGEDTLVELKTAIYAAETEILGGVSARIPPFAAVKDLGAALQRAGLALPVADVDSVSVRFGEPLRLLRDLQAMGETNSLAAKSRPVTRALISRALQILAENGGTVRFDIVYLTGWAPHESQQKPLKPGSAKASMEAAVRSSKE